MKNSIPRKQDFRPFSTGLTSLVLTVLIGIAVHAQEAATSIRLTTGWELQDAAKVSQTGEALSKPDFQSTGWLKATVPGTVLTSLVNDGVYPEPLYGENNRTIPDTLCRTAYWYRTPFLVPQSFAGKEVWLNFNGINYTADVWVNGHLVGNIKGAFARGIFDVTKHVTVGKTNILVVLISPQPHPGVTHEKTIADGTGLNGGVTAADGPSFMCTIGWDWIPTIRDRDMGIWQDVTLTASGPVVIQDPFVTSELPLPKTDSADLTVQAYVRNATDTAQAGVLKGQIEDIRFEQTVTLKPNESRVVTFTPATTPALHIKNPRLWWPNGYGKPNLYSLRLNFSINSAISDKREINFGIRQLGYSLPGSDNLALTVNGIPVMVKGGDWGMDEAMKRIPRARLEAEVRMHQMANYTLIRNWVGQSTSEDLYDLCDRYGILMWDEFFQPNPCDGPVPDDVDLYLTNIREKILRFRHHPCIALWCARNEGDPPPNIGQGIQKLIDALDPHRLYQPSSSSGRGVASGGPYHWRTPREFYDWNEAFKTEIGSISVPTLEAIRGMMPSKDWEVINDDWAEHDFCAGAQAGDVYPHMITSRYGAIANLSDFVRKSQLANYECFRAMYEGRFAKLFKPSTGVITWMSAPCQPSFVWQLYSYDLEPNSSLFATRLACEPVHIMLNQKDWHVMVVNNTTEKLSGVTARTVFFNLDGKKIYGPSTPLTLDPSAVTDAGELAFPKDLSAVHFVSQELLDSNNHVLSRNFYWRSKPEMEDNFLALNTLEKVTLNIKTTRKNLDGKCLITATIRNPAPVVALMTHLQLRKARSNERVLPVYYSDNYISLLPGETRTVAIEAAVADLDGQEPTLAVDGWNISTKTTKARHGTVRVFLNRDAQVRKEIPQAPSPVDYAGISCGKGKTEFFSFGKSLVIPTALEGTFEGDLAFVGGKTADTTVAVNTEVRNAAPQAVYQSERYGNSVYTVRVKSGKTYTVRLHFAETKFEAGKRKFNVEINGQRVLNEFDIAAEAGKNKALVKEFTDIHPNGSGDIVISLKQGSADQPKICGIQILKKP